MNASCAVAALARGACRRGSSTTASGRPSSVRMLVGEVVERVAVLGEDDQLAAAARRRRASRRVVLEQLARARPTCGRCPSARTRSASCFEPLQVGDLGLELGDRLRGRRLVDDAPPRAPRARRRRQVVDRPRSSSRASARSSRRSRAPRSPSRSSCRRALEPLAAALERLVDRLGLRGEPALQDGEREADRRCLAALASPRAGRRGSSPRGRTR